MNHVFVLKSFLLRSEMRRPETFIGPTHAEIEWGNMMLFGSMADVETYIQALRDGGDDRPFECRWKYFVVEKVPLGPYPYNEVMGWWRGTRRDEESIMGYDVVKLERSPIPDSDGIMNWTMG